MVTLFNWQQFFLVIYKIMVILKFIIGGILNLMKYGIYSFSFYNSFLLLSWSCFCCFLYVLMYSVLDSILEMFCTYSFKFSFNQALFKAVVFLIFKGFRFGFFFSSGSIALWFSIIHVKCPSQWFLVYLQSRAAISTSAISFITLISP